MAGCRDRRISGAAAYLTPDGSASLRQDDRELVLFTVATLVLVAVWAVETVWMPRRRTPPARVALASAVGTFALFVAVASVWRLVEADPDALSPNAVGLLSMGCALPLVALLVAAPWLLVTRAF